MAVSCTIHRSTDLPGLGYQQRGSTPRKPVRWSVNYEIRTPAGEILIENTRIIPRADIHQLLEIMGAYIDRIAQAVVQRFAFPGGVFHQR